MLFKPVKNSNGMIMSINEAYIPYLDMVKILGKPDSISKDKVEWLRELMGVTFQVKYSSTTWALREYDKSNEKSKSIKFPGFEKMNFCEIYGNPRFVRNVIIKILYTQIGENISSGILKGIITSLFENKLEEHK